MSPPAFYCGCFRWQKGTLFPPSWCAEQAAQSPCRAQFVFGHGHAAFFDSFVGI
jgi:hypothetical protein